MQQMRKSSHGRSTLYNANMGWITRRVTSNSQVGSELMLRYKNELNRILVTQYR